MYVWLRGEVWPEQGRRVESRVEIGGWQEVHVTIMHTRNACTNARLGVCGKGLKDHCYNLCNGFPSLTCSRNRRVTKQEI